MKIHRLSFVSISAGLLLYWGSWVGVVRAAASAADSSADEGLRKVFLRQAGTGAISNAADGLRKYLTLPIGANVGVGGGRMTRLGALARLSQETNVLPELHRHWPAITNAALWRGSPR